LRALDYGIEWRYDWDELSRQRSNNHRFRRAEDKVDGIVSIRPKCMNPIAGASSLRHFGKAPRDNGGNSAKSPWGRQ
jgi:hypothetical protein